MFIILLLLVVLIPFLMTYWMILVWFQLCLYTQLPEDQKHILMHEIHALYLGKKKFTDKKLPLLLLHHSFNFLFNIVNPEIM